MPGFHIRLCPDHSLLLAGQSPGKAWPQPASPDSTGWHGWLVWHPRAWIAFWIEAVLLHWAPKQEEAGAHLEGGVPSM